MSQGSSALRRLQVMCRRLHVLVAPRVRVPTHLLQTLRHLGIPVRRPSAPAVAGQPAADRSPSMQLPCPVTERVRSPGSRTSTAPSTATRDTCSSNGDQEPRLGIRQRPVPKGQWVAPACAVDLLALDAVTGDWTLDARQGALGPRLRANVRPIALCVIVLALAIFNSLAMPLVLERHTYTHPRSSIVATVAADLSIAPGVTFMLVAFQLLLCCLAYIVYCCCTMIPATSSSLSVASSVCLCARYTISGPHPSQACRAGLLQPWDHWAGHGLASAFAATNLPAPELPATMTSTGLFATVERGATAAEVSVAVPGAQGLALQPASWAATCPVPATHFAALSLQAAYLHSTAWRPVACADEARRGPRRRGAAIRVFNATMRKHALVRHAPLCCTCSHRCAAVPRTGRRRLLALSPGFNKAWPMQELAKMSSARHARLIMAIEIALVVMRLSCEGFFVLLAAYFAYLARAPAHALAALVRAASATSYASTLR